MTALMVVCRFWKEALIVALVLGLAAACHARDAAIRDRARAEVYAHQADSALAVVTPTLLRVDTLLVHDTTRVAHTVARLDTLRDTVLTHLTDTLLVREYVTRADSAASACLELSNSCQSFRAYALQKFALDSIKLRAPVVAVSHACVTPSVITGVLGIAAGLLAGRR